MAQGLKISLIIPAYNEGSGLLDNLDKAIAYFNGQSYTYEIIVVDDGSCDGSGDLLKRYAQEHAPVKAIRNSRNLGKGASVKTGVLSASGEYIIFSDADFSVPIEELPKIISPVSEGFDLAIGSRALPESNIVIRQPWYRQAMGKFFNLLIRVFVLRGIKDTQCGFKCFKNEAARKIFRLQSLTGFSFDVEDLCIARLCGYKIKEVPVTWINRKNSRVRIIRDSLRMLLDLFKIRINSIKGMYKANN